MKLRRRWQALIAGIAALTVAACAYYVTHPLVFNESFWEHAHCLLQASIMFRSYADNHNGSFPSHERGYGDALMLLEDPTSPVLTGPGFTEQVFIEAQRSGGDVPEEKCGRVYIPGFNKSILDGTCFFFDKKSTPGGDHCHLWFRFTVPRGREVLVSHWCSKEFVSDDEWPAFVDRQIELLTKQGFDRVRAEAIYAPYR